MAVNIKTWLQALVWLTAEPDESHFLAAIEPAHRTVRTCGVEEVRLDYNPIPNLEPCNAWADLFNCTTELMAQSGRQLLLG